MCHGERKKKKTALCLFGFCNEVETKVKYIDYVSPPAKMMVIGGGSWCLRASVFSTSYQTKTPGAF